MIVEGQEMTSNEQLCIRLDGRGNRLYFPGETLAGSYSLNEIRQSIVESIEISVLWSTEGKGNEDVGVHAFWRLSNQNGDWMEVLRPGRFSVVLPQSPLTYNGNILKIRWCVRIRAFLSNGSQLLEETPFYLGDLPDMRTLKLCAG